MNWVGFGGRSGEAIINPENMRQILSLALTLLMVMQLAPAVFCAESVASQITALPLGTKVEVRLKNKRKMRGTTGAVSNSGFAFVDASAGQQQIAFDDVVSVKRLDKKSHTTRNVLIVVGIGLTATAIGLGIYIKKCAPFGCNAKPFPL
jgi:hypothetical protein